MQNVTNMGILNVSFTSSEFFPSVFVLLRNISFLILVDLIIFFSLSIARCTASGWGRVKTSTLNQCKSDLFFF